MKPSMGFVLGALCVGALGIAGSQARQRTTTPRPLSYYIDHQMPKSVGDSILRANGAAVPDGEEAALARGSITTHVGHALRWRYSISTDTVLSVAPGTILPLRCGTSRTFSRLWDVDTAKKDSTVVWGDSVSVFVTPPCRTETPIPPPVDTTLKIVVASDFESGSFGPQFYDPWAGEHRIDVVADPTPRASGKVVRFHYITNGTTQADDNKALLPQPATLVRGLGQDVWFEGDFYLDPAARMDATGPNMVQRKIFRFGWDGMSTPHRLETELTSFGPQFCLIFAPDQSFGASQYISTSVVSLTPGAWHHVKLYQKNNSAYGVSDGVLRVWYDKILLFDRSDLRWSDPSWTDPVSTYIWNSWGFGDQVSAASAVDEYRYWDNVTFSVKP